MPFAKKNHPISSLEDWLRYAPPKLPEHWADDRSAKEVARAWLDGGNNLPVTVSSLLESHSSFGKIISWVAEPEAKLRFDSFRGEPRNSDIVVYAVDSNGRYLIAVEAKADEPFDKTITKKWLEAERNFAKKPESKGLERIKLLKSALFDPHSIDAMCFEGLRYQLLTATAGAVAEASRKGYTRSVLLIHEFVSKRTRDENHVRNAQDLSAFVSCISRGEVEKLSAGELYGPYRTVIAPEVELYIAKITSNLRNSL